MDFEKLDSEEFYWLNQSSFYSNLDEEDCFPDVIFCSKYTDNANLFLEVEVFRKFFTDL